jgi:hypothetical protein
MKREEYVFMKKAPLFGAYGSAALPVIDQCKAHGANALWFHGFNPEAFSACQKHGIAACVEFKTFRADFKARPDLIPIGVDGQPIRYGDLVQGVCLSKKDFLAEIENHLEEGLRQFQPAGIWLDYLTYGGWFEVPDPDLQESCFCSACIADFCDAQAIDAFTPEQILSAHASAWQRHKCQRIARFARRYAEIIRSHLPECIIGAYMCPWTPDEFSGALSRIFAQDYDLLAPSVDIFTPLIYAVKSGRNASWGRDFLESSPQFVPADRKVQLILDALDYPESLLTVAESRVPSWGIQIFGGARIFSEDGNAQYFRRAVEQIKRYADYETRSNGN